MRVADQIAIELKRYSTDVVFGIVGIPIVDLAESLVKHGIRFIACRNEQSCSYAASAYGYLTGKPGVILVVGGPGVIHALAGVYNSYMNKWPLILMAGSTEDEYHGGFQELDQLRVLSQWSAFSARVTPLNIGHLIYTATKTAILQRTVAYIDIPGRLMEHEAHPDANTSFLAQTIEKLKPGPDPEKVRSAAALLQSGKRILVVIGRGCIDYSIELREFVEKYELPFLPTPMAKGIAPDSHELNVNSARSRALKTAEVVLVLGARLNWMLHFGAPPKWNQDAIFIQVDHDPSSLGQNNSRGIQYSIHSDVGLFISSLSSTLPASWKFGGVPEDLLENIRANMGKLHARERLTPGTPLNYHAVYAEMRKFIDDRSTILAIEGANTMDIARICFPTDFPKHRLDAGTNATMGVGIGYAMAAKIAEPEKYVVAIQGDSAFGFSCMELETITRNKLGIVVVVMNNGGIYHGNDGEHDVKTTDLTPECRYEIVGQGLGCDGAIVYSIDQLKQEFPKALAQSQQGITTVLNVIIEPGKQSKLSFGWQSKSKI